MKRWDSDERAVAPVVGVSLLIGITVILAAVIGAVVLGVNVGPTDTPQATLSFVVTEDDSLELYHEGGDALDGDEVVVVNETGETVHDLDGGLTTGEQVEIVEDLEQESSDRLSVVWQDPSSSSESVLATFRP